MTRSELRDYRRLRWLILNRRRWKKEKETWYKESESWLMACAESLSPEDRTILVEYYHNVRPVVWLSIKLGYSERTVARKKKRILNGILG